MPSHCTKISLMAASGLSLALAPCLAFAAGLGVAAMFSDDAVLQQGRPVPVWGRAAPGTKVDVRFGTQLVEATTDGSGRWEATLAAMPATFTPERLVVTGDGEKIEYAGIVVGEVWFLSGQSNMEWRLVHSDGGRETLAHADNSNLRFMMAEPLCSARPNDDAVPAWRKEGQAASWQRSRTWSANRVGAIPFHFGAQMQAALNVPVGVVQAALGGTLTEAWTPRFVFAEDKRFTRDLAWLKAAEARQSEAEMKSLDEYRNWFSGLAGNSSIMSALAQSPPPQWPRNPGSWYNRPTCFYNGMIHGMTPYALAGMAWYQGESNVPQAEEFEARLSTFVAAMRKVWRNDSLPFGIVQLAPFDGLDAKKMPLAWEAQLAVARSSHAGLITISDLVPDLGNLHPPDKKSVSERLTRWALHSVYGRADETPTGPIFRESIVEKDRIRVLFDNGAGLSGRGGSAIGNFEIAGADQIFFAADARIETDSVVLSSPSVKRPIAVRFGWSQVAQPNLVNAAGFPAASFRTDRWPVSN